MRDLPDEIEKAAGAMPQQWCAFLLQPHGRAVGITDYKTMEEAYARAQTHPQGAWGYYTPVGRSVSKVGIEGLAIMGRSGAKAPWDYKVNDRIPGPV